LDKVVIISDLKSSKKLTYKTIPDHLSKQQLYILCRHKESVEIMELNVQADHIHLVISIAPKYSVSSLMGYIKGKLSLRLFQRYEKIGKQMEKLFPQEKGSSPISSLRF